MSDIDDCLKSVERLTRERGEVMAKAERLRAEVARMREEMPVAESLRVDAKCADIERDEARAVVWKQAKENADLRAEIERLTRKRDEARAEAQRLRASNERLHRALFRIAGKAPFADDPWTIAMEAMKREAKP